MAGIGSYGIGRRLLIEELAQEEDSGLEGSAWSILHAFQNDRLGEVMQLRRLLFILVSYL
jgi:hypothetical protein